LGFIDLKVILIELWSVARHHHVAQCLVHHWPNQQSALNIGNAYPDLPVDQKAKAARTAGLSRTNAMLSGSHAVLHG